MHHGIIIGLKLTRQLSENDLDALINDLNSFRKHSRVSGKLRGTPNHIWNIYDETEFDEVSNTFHGGIRIYAEVESRDALPLEDIRLICDHYEVVFDQLVRKWII